MRISSENSPNAILRTDNEASASERNNPSSADTPTSNVDASQLYNSASESRRLLDNEFYQTIEESTSDGSTEPPEQNSNSLPDYDFDLKGDNIGIFTSERSVNIRLTGNNNYVEASGDFNRVELNGLGSRFVGSGDGFAHVRLQGKGHSAEIGDGGSFAVATGLAHTINGGNGRDELIAHLGNNIILNGGAGRDILRNDGDGTGNVLSGGDDNDLMFTIASTHAEFRGDAGDDSIEFVNRSSENTGYGGTGNDRFRFGDESHNNVGYGGTGDDSFTVEQGSLGSEAYGGAGDDTFTGAAYYGSVFHGGTGADTLNTDIPFSDGIVIEPLIPSESQGVLSQFVIREAPGAPVAFTFSGVETINFLGGSAALNSQGEWILTPG